MNNIKLVVVAIKGTSNNTLLVVTDITERFVLYKTTGGMNTKLGRDKNSVKLATVLFSNVNECFTGLGIKNLIIKWRNRGAGYDTHMTSAVRSLVLSFQRHYNVIKVIKTTPVIHGFLKIKKPKHR